MNYKIAQLIVNPTKNSSSLADIYIAQTEEPQEKLAGKLFAIIEAESKTADDFKVVNFLIDQIEHNYYQHEKFLTEDDEKQIKVEHIFETALAKTNKNLLDLLRQEKIAFNPATLNATVGVIHGNNLYFANIGKNKAFLIYKDKVPSQSIKAKNQSKEVVPINELKYKAADIIEQTGSNEETKPINQAKIFSSVISGAIPTGGYLVFTNEALLEFFSQKQLINIITTLPPLSATEQIKNTLSQVNAYVSFLAIILKNTIGLNEEEIRLENLSASTGQSIKNLNAVEEKTEKLLSPGGYINFRKWLIKTTRTIYNLTLGVIGFGKAKIPETDILKDRMLAKKRSTLLFAINVLLFIKNSFISFFAIIPYFFKFITSKERMAMFFAVSRIKIKSFFSNLGFIIIKPLLWLKNLNLKNKLILAVTVASIALLFINITTTGLENKKDQEAISLAETARTIEQKQNQIEANLLYGNEDMIKKLLTDTKDLLDKLPKSEVNGNLYQNYFNKYNEQLEKIRHVETLDNLLVLSDFSKLDETADPSNLIIVPSKENFIYSSDLKKKTIYKFSIKDKAASAIFIGTTTNDLKFPSADKNNLYYLSKNQVVIFNASTEKISFAPIKITGNEENIVSAKAFNNNLYLVNRLDGQVYRHTYVANSFSGGERWLDQAADLSKASSIDINGMVYIAKTDGQMLKFLKGGEEKLILDSVEPAISDNVKLLVGTDEAYYYLLEPAQKRLLIFEGSGKFILQYQSKQFTNLKDFSIDEKTKTMYFLNGATILQAEARHFK